MANKPTKPNFPLGLESQDQSVFQEGILNNGVVEHGPDAVMTVPETPDASGVPSAVRYNEDDDQFEGFYNEGGWLPLGGGNGGRWEALPHASSSLLQAGRAYLVDNTDGVSTVLFPSPKRIGDSVTVCDLYGKFSTYPLTVDGNGKSIYGSADSMTISTDNVSATFTWTGEARGWVITSGVGLGQGRVYSREIYSQILSASTPSIILSTQPSIVDVYVDGKRLKESLYTLDGYEVKFDPALASGSDVQIIQYIPIQLGAGGGGSGGTVITWEYNGGSAIGGETQIVLDVVVDSVSEIYIRGQRQQIGRGFTFDPSTSTITLADELEAGDDVVVVINGDPTVYNQIDRTPWEVARANNVSNSEVILSTDKTSVLDGKTVLYDVATQTSWGIPSGIAAGVRIISVDSGVLKYKENDVEKTIQLDLPVNFSPNLELRLRSLGGAEIPVLQTGESVQDAIKFVTPLLKSGIENAEYNYSVLQNAANKNKPLDLPKGDFYVSQAFQAGKGQIIKGQGNPNFSPNCYTRLICMAEGGGCIWYTQDTSTGQVRMPQIYDMGLTGDYPVRFNNEQTAIIKDDISLSNVPFGMVPKVINCAINPRVNGVGIGISWSKMFDGIITCCEVANFDIDVLLNGCDLNWVAHNRIRNGWRYMVLELSASTFGSQNIIYHNDVLHAGSPNCIMIKSTARHARIIDNYLEQATGTDGQALIGFIDATDIDAPSYAGNTSAGRYSTILRDNRIDGFSKAKNFVYKYQPKGQTYGEIVDVSTVGSNVGLGSNALTLVDETGATVDSVPLLYNQQQPCSFVFKGPRFGKWNGYTSEGQFSDVINGLNVGAFGTSLYGNLMSNYLRARGNEILLMAGFASTGIFSYAASAGMFEPEKSYIIEVEAYCTSGTEDFTFGGIVSGTGKVSTTFTLSTTPKRMRVEFVTGISGSSNGIYFSRSNNGADIVIKRIRFLKKYLNENTMSASTSKTMQITTQSGEIHIAANGGNQFPAYKILKFINGVLVEIFSQATSSSVIDISWSYSSGTLTVNVTGTGGSKQLAISQTSQPG